MGWNVVNVFLVISSNFEKSLERIWSGNISLLAKILGTIDNSSREKRGRDGKRKKSFVKTFFHPCAELCNALFTTRRGTRSAKRSFPEIRDCPPGYFPCHANFCTTTLLERARLTLPLIEKQCVSF